MKLLVQGLKKSFTQGNNTIEPLKNINFKIETGQIVALLGSSGSGKSTLFSLLSGLQNPDQGEIWYDSLAWHLLPEENKTEFRGKNIGIIFQSHLLIPHLNAFENICLPLNFNKISHSEQIASKWISSVGLSHRKNHRPSELSGGESQRIAIARALCHNPQIILADEPTGQLDAETGEQITELMFDLFKKQKSTVLMITHDLKLAKKCDSILQINNGQILSETSK